jgi:pimeloyl-ACP methyl ester carboxylesterase
MPYILNGDIRIHYEIEGSGPALVMQHGFTDSLATWYDGTSRTATARCWCWP